MLLEELWCIYTRIEFTSSFWIVELHVQVWMLCTCTYKSNAGLEQEELLVPNLCLIYRGWCVPLTNNKEGWVDTCMSLYHRGQLTWELHQNKAWSVWPDLFFTDNRTTIPGGSSALELKSIAFHSTSFTHFSLGFINCLTFGLELELGISAWCLYRIVDVLCSHICVQHIIG